ncbi:uncharacterized protein CANTADRAFT_7471 [Suhomyces tanzawaensis NRRL Y-17324]|uniref:RNase III domain-containing protein n=1 Tax=Suhomyces tanzawaensis NRRL Y-17324 TaxID=984487 RepID=A0A1E4SEU7_9ASCO|nr:uncharacterized protein CANTADRAFT_7471 [Suhomyces tanzawaensis NRRL Y-17324]ODV78003.1 hypothetical protein CANTADRAFT_7471 [Suhomyces tanzawaensis NRRL Y-17324]
MTIIRIGSPQASRFLARSIYLHKGPRVTGLKKDPQEAFTTNTGYKYEKSENNLKYIKGFLQDKYAISDDLALQVLTHKSFNNGVMPYNEKLSAMGSKLANLFFAKYVTEGSTNNENNVNGKNLDVLGSPIAKELSGRMTMGLFARSNELNKVMFWNSYGHGLGFETSGEMKVSAQMMYALIGAVAFSHGKEVGEQFIREKLLGGRASVEDITVRLVSGETSSN